MSTPAENIDTSAAGSAALSLSPEDAWITQLGIDDPVDGTTSPLPTDSGAILEDAPEGAEAKTGADTKEETAPPLDAAAKPEGAKAPASEEVQAAKPEERPDVLDPELTAEENDLIKALPEAEQSTARKKFNDRTYFMGHYLNPDKPAAEIRAHLKEKSPSRYAELETSILSERLTQPETFAADLYQRAPETYETLAKAVYKGDTSYFTELVTGRKDVDPATVQTALDFYERNKDRITDDQPLSELDEGQLAEIEGFFPEHIPTIRKVLEDKAKLAEENQKFKDQLEKKAPAEDPKKAEALQQEAIDKEVNDLWNVGRNAIRDHVSSKAYDPKTGVGIHVSAEEREAAPMVAMLKDFKAQLIFEGLSVNGKPLLDDFEKGLTEWGKSREGFMKTVLHMSKFTQAREKDNVLELAKSATPYADVYFNERLKHPLFAQIDSIIRVLTEQGKTTPKFDRTIPGALPSAKGTATQDSGNGDDWLIRDAVHRAAG